MKHRDPVIVDVFACFGGASSLAKKLGLTRQCVSQWEKIPLKYVRDIARQTKIPLRRLRPDIYAEM
jgi:DNA-binding transcriptional regulator YdaS (Cro superfamily)